MRIKGKASFALLSAAISAAPAFANNPPQPDAALSVLLILPITLIAMRIASLSTKPESSASKWATVLILVLCIILTLAGTVIGVVGLIGIAVFAIRRCVQVFGAGRGWKRSGGAAVALAWLIFACGNYFVSITSNRSSLAFNESAAVHELRNLFQAEMDYANSKSTGSNGYASLDELSRARLVPSTITEGEIFRGYRFHQILEPDRKQFLFYTVPAITKSSRRRWLDLIPGTSIFLATGGERTGAITGIRSCSVCEDGVIRCTTLAETRSVSRAEATSWTALQ